MRSLDVAACLLLAATFSDAQRLPSTTFDPVEETNTVVSTTSVPIATPTGDGEPCAQISALQASFLRANPRATAGPRIPATLATDCGNSVPFVQQDAADLMTGLLAMVQFQSTLDFLPSPPASYPIAGIDLVAELNAINDQVNSDGYSSELEFERALVTVLSSAHDGHLAFIPDGLSVFVYGHVFGPLTSISQDGTSTPQLFLYNEMAAYVSGGGSRPLAINQINGVDATEYILEQTLNATFGGYHDPDAAYNAYLWSPNRGEGPSINPGLFSGSRLGQLGATTSIQFEDGSVVENENFAITDYDFDGVTDGQSFYDSFCNAAVKAAALQGLVRRADPADFGNSTFYERFKEAGFWSRPKSAPKPLPHLVARQYSGGILGGPPTAYPDPETVSEDGSIAGYFLTEPGFEDVAVLLVRSFSLGDTDSFQSTVTTFLDACRSENKQRLIIDMTGNPGGVVALGYDLFKQLFPTLEPWAANNLRAHEGTQLLGEQVTEISSSVLRQSPNNYELFRNSFGTTPYAAESKLTVDQENFTDWADFYGPVEAPNNRGFYTNQFRLDLSNADFSEAIGDIVISGYDENNSLAPQPFEPQNMIIMTDGQCSSMCATLAHLLKWQGKVKSVALGGRPRNGPMQTVGGVKGSQVQTFYQLFLIAAGVYSYSAAAVRNSWRGTTLQTVLEYGEYLLLRTRSAGASPNELAFNIQNNIAEGDRSITPTQFIYEAADCRLFLQEQHIFDVSTRWNTVAATAFGLNGTNVFDACVSGSTGRSSSLSGNPELFNDGQIVNATSDSQDYGIAETSDAGGGGSGSDSSDAPDDAANALGVSALTTCLVAFAATLVSLM